MRIAFGVVLALSAGIGAYFCSAQAAGSASYHSLHQPPRNGRWIAYSTAPVGNGGESCGRSPGDRCGSDVFVTRVGGRPRLVAGRRGRKVWNLCPAFAPNGRMLAFARVTGTQSWKAGSVRSTIVVVRVGPRGSNGAPMLVLKVAGGLTRCPSWSADSSRLAYLNHGRTRVVVRDLHGLRRHRSAEDPTIHDFDRAESELVSPTGALIAKQGSQGTIVSRPDGSDQRLIPGRDYAIAAWSPDGRKLLLMTDVGGGFRMRAVSVDLPSVGFPSSETVVGYVRVNNPRSWPGNGDVSWQPAPQTSRSLEWSGGT